MSAASKNAPKVGVLDRVSCICYSVQFHKDKGKDVLALLNSKSEVNAITPASAAYLGLRMRGINVSVQKIDGSSLVIYGMVVIVFQIVNKLGRSWFFQETFLLVNISMKMV